MSIHRIPDRKPFRKSKPDDPALFQPVQKTFADLHREWHELRAQAAVTRTPSTLEYLARRQTAILESFPQWERSSIIDRLNEPIEAEGATYAKAN